MPVVVFDFSLVSYARRSVWRDLEGDISPFIEFGFVTSMSSEMGSL